MAVTGEPRHVVGFRFYGGEIGFGFPEGALW